eukprot:Rmarinus@m.27244
MNKGPKDRIQIPKVVSKRLFYPPDTRKDGSPLRKYDSQTMKDNPECSARALSSTRKRSLATSSPEKSPSKTRRKEISHVCTPTGSIAIAAAAGTDHSSGNVEEIPEHSFDALRIVLVKRKLPPTQVKIFETQVKSNGGAILEPSDVALATHVITALPHRKAVETELGESVPKSTCVVRPAWLAECLRRRTVVSVYPHLTPTNAPASVLPYSPSSVPGGSSPPNSMSSQCTSPAQESGSEGRHTQKGYSEPGVTLSTHSSGINSSQDTYDVTATAKDEFQGIESDSQSDTGGDRATEPEELNDHIIKPLKILIQDYDLSPSKTNVFRKRAMSEAIAKLKKLDYKVETVEQAAVLFKNKTLEKVTEVLSTGSLRRAEAAKQNPDFAPAKLFNKVWGAGPQAVQSWLRAGYRTLEDLRTKANLTSQQKIGVELYDDINTKMPREEASQIESRVRDVVRRFASSETEVFCCGSFRRGKPSCGDCDVIISDPESISLESLLTRVVSTLRHERFLTHDLTKGSHKYMGVCRLGPQCKHRRIDLSVVEHDQLPFALLHYTGSGPFNQAIRLYADKHGFHLNDKHLLRGVTRVGHYPNVQVSGGTPVAGIQREEDVFRALGLQYQPPADRNGKDDIIEIPLGTG